MKYSVQKMLCLFMLTLCFLSWIYAQDKPKPDQEFRVGEAVRDFELKDTKGESFKFSEQFGKIIVICFWSARCPYVARYEERLKKIVADYASKNVLLIAIDSNIDETSDEIRAVAEKQALPYRILLDPNHEVADRFGAISTPHIFIIDSFGELSYEGSIDDQGWEEAAIPKENYVRGVLDALLDEKSPPHFHTIVFGCNVKRELPKEEIKAEETQLPQSNPHPEEKKESQTVPNVPGSH